jgi:hypothetical protein
LGERPRHALERVLRKMAKKPAKPKLKPLYAESKFRCGGWVLMYR